MTDTMAGRYMLGPHAIL